MFSLPSIVLHSVVVFALCFIMRVLFWRRFREHVFVVLLCVSIGKVLVTELLPSRTSAILVGLCFLITQFLMCEAAPL